MERAICAHLIHIANTLLHLTNSKVTVGMPTDTLIRLLTQFYVCLNNVSKHLITRHCILPVVYSHIQFDKLVKISGKPLAGRVYDFITYIDKNLLYGDQSPAAGKNSDVSSEKTRKKVIRDTRSVPKLIRWIETLHKYITVLGKKTNNDISAYLHIGIVRDFRIKNLDTGDLNDDDDDAENRASADEGDETDVESVSTEALDVSEEGISAQEKILKNVARLKKKAPVKTKAATRGKRSRSSVVVPDAAGILGAINGNKSPAKKRARRSK